MGTWPAHQGKKRSLGGAWMKRSGTTPRMLLDTGKKSVLLPSFLGFPTNGNCDPTCPSASPLKLTREPSVTLATVYLLFFTTYVSDRLGTPISAVACTHHPLIQDRAPTHCLGEGVKGVVRAMPRKERKCQKDSERVKEAGGGGMYTLRSHVRMGAGKESVRGARQ